MRNPVIKNLIIIINGLILLLLYRHADGLPGVLVGFITVVCILTILLVFIIKSPDQVAEERVEKRMKKRYR